jgi:hypothetical protein
MSKYFIVTTSEDAGGFRIDGPFDAAEVERRITPDKFGYHHYGNCEPQATLPDPDYGPSLLIIKGEIVVPRAVATVTKWEVP